MHLPLGRILTARTLRLAGAAALVVLALGLLGLPVDARWALVVLVGGTLVAGVQRWMQRRLGATGDS